MHWINAYRHLPGADAINPVDRSGNRPTQRPETAFADILASRINEASVMSGNPLSPATVKLLAMILTRHLDHLPATGMPQAGPPSPTETTIRPRSPEAAVEPPPASESAAATQPEDPSPSRTDFSGLIHKAAERYHLDPALISSIIETESNFDPKAVSDAGAQGLMQLMPQTAHELKVTDPFDPAQNIDGGSRYLSHLMKRYHGDAKLALAAYNWGMGNLEKQPERMPAETKHYIADVMARWDRNRSTTA